MQVPTYPSEHPGVCLGSYIQSWHYIQGLAQVSRGPQLTSQAQGTVSASSVKVPVGLCSTELSLGTLSKAGTDVLCRRTERRALDFQGCPEAQL